MQFTPINDRVLVRRLNTEEITRSGIIIPGSAQEKPSEGQVIAIGRGKINADGTITELLLKKGDRVAFGKYSGAEIKFEGEEYVVMKEDEILGVFSDEQKS